MIRGSYDKSIKCFSSTASAPAYAYDPYGNALQATAPLTDFNYAGMFYNADSGLYLTQYRAYDPVAGRWLSRDPVGEVMDLVVRAVTTTGSSSVAETVDNGSYRRAATMNGTVNYRREPAIQRHFGSLSWRDVMQKYAESRFGSEDPIGLASVVNLYAYVEGNPVSWSDPHGLIVCISSPLSPDCQAVKVQCITECSDTALPSGDFGFRFWNCVNRCMTENGC